MTTNYTIASQPPARTRRPGARSTWGPTLAEARTRPGEWRRLARPMTKKTVVQTASDLRNGAKRAPEKRRIKAVREGDVWECSWGEDATVAGSDNHFLWIRWSPATAW